MLNWFRGRKPVGAVVQHRDGYAYVKTEEGWIAEHRIVAALKVERRELMTGEKVYHKDGNRENNKPDNLAVIRFNTTKYRLLPAPRLLFMPKAREAIERQA